MSDSKPKIAFAKHWRAELVDVAHALAEVGLGRVEVVGGGRVLGPRGRTPEILVLSDPPRADETEMPERRPTARLWWNDAPEVEEAAHLGRIRAHELNVVFFPETAATFRAHGFAVIEIPYAFAIPTRLVGSSRTRATYTGEVDTTDDCFAAYRGSRARELSALATEIAAAVVTGELALVAAAEAATAGGAEGRNERDGVLWAVRNRVRFQLMDAIIRSVPGQVLLRGTDWRQHGFPASRTPLRRITRRRSYRRSRTALDFGAKSGNAVLSPRSAEILAVGGGLVQFDSGAPIPGMMSTMTSRQASSASTLVDLVVQDLGLEPAAALTVRQTLHHEYLEVRRSSSEQLLDALLRHAG